MNFKNTHGTYFQLQEDINTVFLTSHFATPASFFNFVSTDYSSSAQNIQSLPISSGLQVTLRIPQEFVIRLFESLKYWKARLLMLYLNWRVVPIRNLFRFRRDLREGGCSPSLKTLEADQSRCGPIFPMYDRWYTVTRGRGSPCFFFLALLRVCSGLCSCRVSLRVNELLTDFICHA